MINDAPIEWLRTIVEDTVLMCMSYSLVLHYIFGLKQVK